MKWFKHDTDATQDAKIRRLLIRYGPTGYAVYFHSLELIAAEFSEADVSLRLEHDAEIIADTLHIKGENAIGEVQEILAFCVDQGLFVESDGVIRCPKILSRIDTSSTSNPKFRGIISQARAHEQKSPDSHDSVMTNHDGIMTESWRSHDGIMTESWRSHDSVMNIDIDLDKTKTKTEELYISRAREKISQEPEEEAVFASWQALGDKVVQVDRARWQAAVWPSVQPMVSCMQAPDVLAALSNLGTILSGPPGKYYFNYRIGARVFFERHVDKFMPANFKPEDFENTHQRQRRQPVRASPAADAKLAEIQAALAAEFDRREAEERKARTEALNFRRGSAEGATSARTV